MSLMTFRHKSLQPFAWLLCFLTFYLGFNHLVMCYELLPQGGIHKIHLQLIECNLLTSYATPSTHSPTKPPVTLSTSQSPDIYPDCRDFHLSFKRKSGFDYLSVNTIVSSLSADYPVISNWPLTNICSITAQYTLNTQTRLAQLNPTRTSLKTVVLLI